MLSVGFWFPYAVIVAVVQGLGACLILEIDELTSYQDMGVGYGAVGTAC